jgi:hypothetical protein
VAALVGGGGVPCLLRRRGGGSGCEARGNDDAGYCRPSGCPMATRFPTRMTGGAVMDPIGGG